MNEGELRTVEELLRRPGTVAAADGIPVAVRSVRLSGSRTHGELVIDYAVPPLRDGVARQPLPRPGQDLGEYADEVAQEVQAWATEHVRRFRPLPPSDREAIRRDLPSRDDLWELLVGEFTDVETRPEGFRGVTRFGRHLTVAVTPGQWQEYVVSCEIGCRNDYGVDADSAGGGPSVAIGDLDETLATMDADEEFVVLDGHRLVGSTRGELPPARGTAGEREHEAIMERLADARRRNPDSEPGWFASPRDEADDSGQL